MNSFRSLSVELARRTESTASFVDFDHGDTFWVGRLPILGAGVAVKVMRVTECQFEVGAIGLNLSGTRWLYDTLVVQSFIKVQSSGKAFLRISSLVVRDSLADEVLRVARMLQALRAQEEAANYDLDSVVSMYWSSGVLNFGDWAGPHLISGLTGRQVVQINRPGAGSRVLYSIGSILGWFKRNNVDVWGSGLMRPFTSDEIAARKNLTGVKIHAVRGRKTKQEVENSLGWSVPDVFGDPALLLPRVMPRSSTKNDKVAFVPHNVHRSQISTLSSSVSLVDVRADVRTVVDVISSSNAVVSSSLHGLIVAQAYNIPWVWLDIVDHQLGGNDFKFEDFFSCLDRSSVSRVQISKSQLENIDVESIAANATLPGLVIDLSALEAALPVSAAKKSHGYITVQ